MEKSMCNACYGCVHRGNIPGDAHSCCKNGSAKVKGAEHGIKNGWFYWPFNFDPVWLEQCDGFQNKEKAAHTSGKGKPSS